MIGIGASAGGLEALRVLVRQLPAGLGVCYAIAQHLSPSRRSMLVELLARETPFKVIEIADGMSPVADAIYVTPPTCHVRFVAGQFKLEPVTQPGIPKPSVDKFFASLAAEFEEHAVGVVLSGTGSDGACGMRAIHSAGGCTVAQDPTQAKYDGMPRAAIESGCVDFILNVDEIGPRLTRLLGQAPVTEDSLSDTQRVVPVIDTIVQTVKRRVGFDLSLYKPRSLQRRIRRRMLATESRSLEVYAELLQTSPDEPERVVREMFISVTQFFRDPEAFGMLDLALGARIEAKPEGEELRIWVPGCATGEEAYSLTMLIAEKFERLQRWPNVRMFATDLDTSALAKARRGIFPSSALEEVPEALAQKYLVQEGDSVRIVKRLRDMVIFSEHNILHDPSFLRIDLISCRNLLIYLQPEVQHRVLNNFAYALRPQCLLFLGKAEALQGNSELFTAIDRASHLYRTTGRVDTQRAVSARHALSAYKQVPRGTDNKSWDLGTWLTNAHADGTLPPFVLVDDDGQLVHVFGDVTPFLILGKGQATLDIFLLAIEPIRLEIRSTLLHAQRQTHQRVSQDVILQDGTLRLQLLAMRREEVGAPPLTLLIFESRPTAVRATDALASDVQDGLARLALEDQLVATRDHLNTVISELESANEELQSLNEEMQSANEELQSANEELETANEELQSTNEELITVNEELESRTAELTARNTDLHNVKNSLLDPVIVVDEHRRVTLFNPHACRVFAIDAASIGALLFSLPCLIDVGDAPMAIMEVIETRRVQHRQLTGERSYLLRIQPYLDIANVCKGAVLTFHDNTELLESAAKLLRVNQEILDAHRFAESTIDALPQMIGVIGSDGRLVSTNKHWRACDDQAQQCTLRCAVGDDYEATLDAAAKEGNLLARKLWSGLKQVRRGESAVIECEYPLIKTTRPRHFRTTITLFNSGLAAEYYGITHEEVTQRVLQDHQVLLQARALNSALSAITISDASQPDFPLVYVNEAFTAITGYESSEVLGKNCRFLQADDTNQPARAVLREALTKQREVRVLLRNYRKDGTLFWNELTLTPITDSGVLTHVVGLQRDVTAKLAREEALRASIERESQALTFAGLGGLELDVRAANISLSEQHARLLGLPGEQRSLSLTDYRHLIMAEDRQLFNDAIKLCLLGHTSLDLEYRVVWADGTQHWIHTRGNVALDVQGVPVRLLALSQDITARKNAEDEVRFIAHHDALTGLPNRALLRDRFQLAINVARRNRTRLAVLFIDLDHFKDINDSLGHEVGDALLVSVAERMRQSLRDTDTVCRQSGDEFIALMPAVRDSNDAGHLAEKIVQAVAMPHAILGHDICITCSAGISLYPDDGETIDALMRHADSAMYHAKGMGRNSVEFFAKEMNADLHMRMNLVNELRKAIEREELTIHYQPQFDVNSNALCGIEALLRWQHPQRGLIYPNAFIQLAEDSNLICEIGDWVLHQACLQAQRWHQAGWCRVPMAVNISPVQLRQRNIMEKVTSALHASGLPPEWLELELTEQALLHDTQRVGELLASFRSQGIRLALDDFGTGYSSLSSLHRFPVDKIKIDRSFVAASPKDSNAAAIVRAVINLARGMSLDLVAEGVETPSQLEFLKNEGCTTFQGFLSSPGVCAQTLETKWMMEAL